MMKSLVQSQFGRAAADYAISDVHAKGESLGRIVELTQPRSSWQGLDVATGAGHTAIAFAPHLASIVASDVTDEMLREAGKLARARGLANVTTAKADATALPFVDGSFDLVTCRLAAHHFPDLERFVAEVRRVLRPGGRFALVDNVAGDAELLSGLTPAEIDEAVTAYNEFEKMRDPSHAFAPPPATWIDLVSNAGLRIVAREQFGKEIDFASWVTRMRVPADVVERLRNMLVQTPTPLTAFLRPRVDDSGELHFTLQEFLLVAER